MKIIVFLLCLLSGRLFAAEMLIVDAGSDSNMASTETAKFLAESEFADGNFGSASFLCEYLEKRNVDDPKFKLLWATAQGRIGNWTKAEKLYLRVVNHKKSTKKQKSLACVYLSKQQTEVKSKEEYADMAIGFSKNDLVVEMVGQIYKDLELDAISKADMKKAEYYKAKYEEFLKNSTTERKNETSVVGF
jgi:hypothetical protein